MPFCTGASRRDLQEAYTDTYMCLRMYQHTHAQTHTPRSPYVLMHTSVSRLALSHFRSLARSLAHSPCALYLAWVMHTRKSPDKGGSCDAIAAAVAAGTEEKVPSGCCLFWQIVSTFLCPSVCLSENARRERSTEELIFKLPDFPCRSWCQTGSPLRCRGWRWRRRWGSSWQSIRPKYRVS